MKKLSLLLLAPILFAPLSGCNLFTKLSTPSGDEQILIAARGCLDHGDFQCALDYYKQLSSEKNDIMVNERALTKLASLKVFSFSDLVASLGSSVGSGSSFATMANDLARRGAALEANRVEIQKIYVEASGISATSNPRLRAFTKFIAALAMFNEILAEVAGSDQTLRSADILRTPGTCNASYDCTTLPAPVPDPCSIPTSPSAIVLGTALTSSPSANEFETDSNWVGTNATLEQLIGAAKEAQAQATAFTGGSNNSGIFSAINTLASLPVGEACIRQTLVSTFGLN